MIEYRLWAGKKRGVVGVYLAKEEIMGRFLVHCHRPFSVKVEVINVVEVISPTARIITRCLDVRRKSDRQIEMLEKANRGKK